MSPHLEHTSFKRLQHLLTKLLQHPRNILGFQDPWFENVHTSFPLVEIL